MVSDVWFLVSDFWYLASAFWFWASWFWILVSYFRFMVSGFWVLDSGVWLLAAGFWLLTAAAAQATQTRTAKTTKSAIAAATKHCVWFWRLRLWHFECFWLLHLFRFVWFWLLRLFRFVWFWLLRLSSCVFGFGCWGCWKNQTKSEHWLRVNVRILFGFSQGDKMARCRFGARFWGSFSNPFRC